MIDFTISSKIQVYKHLKIKDIYKPQNKYKNIFTQQKQLVNKNPYKFGGAGDLEILYNICKINNIKNILETGVANGWSSLAILLSIDGDENKNLTSIDLPYPFKDSEKYIGLAVPKNLRQKWNLIIDDDKKIINNFVLIGKKFDFVHYDSDKSYSGRIKSYNLIWKILSSKGILMSDDVSDNNAFVEFAKQKNVKYYIYKFESKNIGIIQK